jgi:hypothetical protein
VVGFCLKTCFNGQLLEEAPEADAELATPEEGNDDADDDA